MLSFPNLVKQVLTLYSNNFRRLFSLLLVTLLWNIAISFIPPELIPKAKIAIPLLAISFVVSAFTELALIGGFSNLIQESKIAPATIFRNAGKRLPWFILLLILWLLSIFFGALFLILPGIIFATWFMFLGAVCLLEGEQGMKAFRKSKQLVSGHFFPLLMRTAGVMLLTLIILGAANEGLTAILKLLALPALVPYIALISTLFGVVLSTLALPIITGTVVTLYYEMKRLKG